MEASVTSCRKTCITFILCHRVHVGAVPAFHPSHSGRCHISIFKHLFPATSQHLCSARGYRLGGVPAFYPSHNASAIFQFSIHMTCSGIASSATFNNLNNYSLPHPNNYPVPTGVLVRAVPASWTDQVWGALSKGFAPYKFFKMRNITNNFPTSGPKLERAMTTKLSTMLAVTKGYDNAAVHNARWRGMRPAHIDSRSECTALAMYSSIWRQHIRL